MDGQRKALRTGTLSRRAAGAAAPPRWPICQPGDSAARRFSAYPVIKVQRCYGARWRLRPGGRGPDRGTLLRAAPSLSGRSAQETRDEDQIGLSQYNWHVTVLRLCPDVKNWLKTER